MQVSVSPHDAPARPCVHPMSRRIAASSKREAPTCGRIRVYSANLLSMLLSGGDKKRLTAAPTLKQQGLPYRKPALITIALPNGFSASRRPRPLNECPLHRRPFWAFDEKRLGSRRSNALRATQASPRASDTCSSRNPSHPIFFRPAGFLRVSAELHHLRRSKENQEPIDAWTADA